MHASLAVAAVAATALLLAGSATAALGVRGAEPRGRALTVVDARALTGAGSFSPKACANPDALVSSFQTDLSSIAPNSMSITLWPFTYEPTNHVVIGAALGTSLADAGTYFGLDTSTGDKLWDMPAPESPDSAFTRSGSVLASTITTNGHVALTLGSDSSKVQIYDARTGDVVGSAFSMSTACPANAKCTLRPRILTPTLAVLGYQVADDGGGKFLNPSADLYAFSRTADSGADAFTPLWNTAGNYTSNPDQVLLRGNSVIVLGNSATGLDVFEATTGHYKWLRVLDAADIYPVSRFDCTADGAYCTAIQFNSLNMGVVETATGTNAQFNLPAEGSTTGISDPNIWYRGTDVYLATEMSAYKWNGDTMSPALSYNVAFSNPYDNDRIYAAALSQSTGAMFAFTTLSSFLVDDTGSLLWDGMDTPHVSIATADSGLVEDSTGNVLLASVKTVMGVSATRCHSHGGGGNPGDFPFGLVFGIAGAVFVACIALAVVMRVAAARREAGSAASYSVVGGPVTQGAGAPGTGYVGGAATYQPPVQGYA